MGTKLSWTGLALMFIPPVLGLGQTMLVAGAIVLVIGVILQWLDK